MEETTIINKNLLLKKHDDDSIYIGVSGPKESKCWTNWVRLREEDLNKLRDFLNKFLEG